MFTVGWACLCELCLYVNLLFGIYYIISLIYNHIFVLPYWQMIRCHRIRYLADHASLWWLLLYCTVFGMSSWCFPLSTLSPRLSHEIINVCIQIVVKAIPRTYVDLQLLVIWIVYSKSMYHFLFLVYRIHHWSSETARPVSDGTMQYGEMRGLWRMPAFSFLPWWTDTYY